MRTISHIMLGGLFAALLAAPVGALARSSYLSTFNSMYGTANTRLDTCSTCHASSTSTWNPYGTDVMSRMSGGSTISQALSAVESLDSDGDRYANKTEILALTFPGDPKDYPVSTACPDADRDGFAVCDGTCVAPAGTTCGDCNDSNANVNPDATEGPFGSATCSDALDNNCDGAVDGADAACVPPQSDYDIRSFSAPATGVIRQPMTLTVTIANAGSTNPGGTITVYGVVGRKTIQVARDQVFSVAPNATTTLSFTVKPRMVGTINWIVSVTDGDPDQDEAAATTIITRK